MTMIAAPMTPARSPSRLGTVDSSWVASGSERWKVTSRTPASSCSCASLRSPTTTITLGLKKFTQPARTSPSERPASRTIRTARASPERTSRTTSRVSAASRPISVSRRASARPPATASRQPTLPHPQTTSSCPATVMWPMSPENANRQDEMFLTGAGGSKAAMERIEQGGLYRAPFLYNPVMSASAIRLARPIVREQGSRSWPSPGSRARSPCPRPR